MVWEATFLCLVGGGIDHQPMRQDISARRSGFWLWWARTIQLFCFPICGVPEFPWPRSVKNPSGGLGLIPGLERSPGEGNGSPLQYPCLGNSTKECGRLWRPWGRKSRTQRLNHHHQHLTSLRKGQQRSWEVSLFQNVHSQDHRPFRKLVFPMLYTPIPQKQPLMSFQGCIPPLLH